MITNLNEREVCLIFSKQMKELRRVNKESLVCLFFSLSKMGKGKKQTNF